MKFLMFYHSLVSDWNHSNAHFLRGIARDLSRRGHAVVIYEPRDGWSRRHLTAEFGSAPITRFQSAYPELRSTEYEAGALDVDQALAGANVVLVHDWNDPALVARLGEHHARHAGYVLLFHDTHHRALSDRDAIATADLDGYDGVLASGRVIRDRYLRDGWSSRAWTWHDAADVTLFKPPDTTGTSPDTPEARDGDIVWIGNWADGERADELRAFLIDPVRELGLRATIYGVRYPNAVIAELHRSGISYWGWMPNYDVPDVFARFRMTVHIRGRSYATALPGMPSIRPFEAMACGIPLVSAPWEDVEGLFAAGEDYLLARDPVEMRAHITTVLDQPAHAQAMAAHARETILARHTCAHRVDELLAICGELSGDRPRMAASA